MVPISSSYTTPSPKQLPAAPLLGRWFPREPLAATLTENAAVTEHAAAWHTLAPPAERSPAAAAEAAALVGALHTALKLLHRKGTLPAAQLQPCVLPVTELLVASALAGSRDGTVGVQRRKSCES
jgi:hypothetical protein